MDMDTALNNEIQPPRKLTVRKGEILQQAGVPNSMVYLVKSGLLRSYSVDEKGKEHIFLFAPEGWIVADNHPPHVPSALFIDALEDSTVLAMPKDFSQGSHHVPALLKRLEVLQERVILLMSATALERYDRFVATYPQILQRVPQKMIASYLGITPEALSKAKGDRARAEKTD